MEPMTDELKEETAEMWTLFKIAGKVLVSIASLFALWGWALFLHYTCPVPYVFGPVFMALILGGGSLIGTVIGNLRMWGADI